MELKGKERKGTGVPVYLDIEGIIAAAKATNCDAVHPGYGFLSENAGFSEAVEKAGAAFVGPGPFAIRAMGDKIESKKLADEAGVFTIPGARCPPACVGRPSAPQPPPQPGCPPTTARRAVSQGSSAC